MSPGRITRIIPGRVGAAAVAGVEVQAAVVEDPGVVDRGGLGG